MKKEIKIIPLILIVILVINLVLFATRRITDIVFWAIIAVIGLIAYKDKLIKKKS